VSRLRRPKAGFWIRLCVVVLYPLDGMLFRIRFRHLERVPPTGGVILAINHISHIDTVLMARFVWQSGRIPRFVIKDTVFELPVVGRVMHGAKQIPVSRGSSDAVGALHAAVDALAAGEAVIIYPEGTITRDPSQWPMQGKTGLARLILLAPEVPVVPVGQWGAQQQRGGMLRRRVAHASAGEPLDMTKYRDIDVTFATLREITDTVMTAIRDQVAELRNEVPPATFFRPQPRRGAKHEKH
jgi:1-acyl-sn-glycerol-3-phosphate acyltransferase